jgi:hypothetical protein
MLEVSGEPERSRLVVQTELGVTPPPEGLDKANQAALDAVQRTYESAGAELHYLGIRVTDG